MSNGRCDAEILEDFDCLFDYPDCSDDLRKSVQCNFAVQQSYISCDIAIEMFLKYPSCKGIQLCCPDTRFDSLKNFVCLFFHSHTFLPVPACQECSGSCCENDPAL